MPALHIRTSRRSVLVSNSWDAVLTEERLLRSHLMKLSLVEGEACRTFVMSSAARALLRPEKKICAGLWAAMN
jgi:hypothetical protein